MNFAYCIDKKFNIQCAVSIFSLLNNVTEDVSIHILHSEPESFEQYSELLNKHSKCKVINMHKVNTESFKFPKLENAHVSSATYFRIYLEKYIQINDFIIYLDADTITVNNPLDLFKIQVAKMREQNYYFGAALETSKNNSKEIFDRLNLKSEKYFNAGVMVFDFNNQNSLNLTNKLLNLTKKLGNNIKHWDQDVLNKFFDSQFFELTSTLNHKLIKNDNMANNDTKIVHYLGSKKPWTFEGLLRKNSIYYQKNYTKLFNKYSYHVTSKWRKKTYLDLLKFLISLKIFSHKDYIKILISTIQVKKH